MSPLPRYGPVMLVPFGGNDDSGYGRVGGDEGVREYCRLKTVWVELGA